MADQDPSPIDTSAPLPFSQAMLDADAQHAKDHPDSKDLPFSQTEVGKLILETESKTVSDYAAGRISRDDYDAVRHVSQEQLDTLREHLGQEADHIGTEAKEWVTEVKEEFAEFQQNHPGVIEDLKTETPTVAHAAEAAELGMNVIEPLITDVVLEGVHELGDRFMGDLGESVQAIVEARAAVPGVTDDEKQESETRLNSALHDVQSQQEKFDKSIEDAEVKASHDFDAARDAIHQAHDYGEQNPDAHVATHALVSDTPDVQQAVTHDAGEA